MIDSLTNYLVRQSRLFLRLSLGLVFLWFGILKLFNVSPVMVMIERSLPYGLGEQQLFLFGLSLFEVLIGIALLSGKFVKLASFALIIHLFIATIAVLYTQGFTPRFPLLSLEGEFVLKNIVLIAAGFSLLSEKKEHKNSDEKK